MVTCNNIGITGFLVCIINVLCVAMSNTPTPTVVVVISEIIAEHSSYLPLIFQRMQDYRGDSNKSALVQFKTVISSNETDTIEEVCKHLRSGVFALVDLSTPRLAPLFKSACQAFGITYISMVDTCYFNYPLQSSDTDVTVEPAAAQMLKVVADIVAMQNLTNVALVYDETFDIQNTPRRILTNIPAQHIYISISNNSTEAMIRVKTIMKINIKTIFVIAGNERAESFLTLLFKEKVINFDPNIFILTKDSTFTCRSCVGHNRMMLITAQINSEALSRFIDFMRRSLQQQQFQADAIKVDEVHAFDVARLVVNAVTSLTASQRGVHNIAQLDCYNVSTLNDSSVEQSKQLALAMFKESISGVFGTLSWLSKDNVIRYNMTLLIKEVTIDNGTQTNMQLVASWTKSGHINMIGSNLISVGKKKTYRVVAIFELPPFVYKTIDANGTAVYTGYCIELLELIAKSRNFEYTIYNTTHAGSMNDEGEWSGAIKELIDGRADIAVGPISVMAERENVIDFTVPYYDLVGMNILMRKPSFDYSLVKFLSVLDKEVWGCIIGAFFLFSVLITIFDKLSPFSYQNRRSLWKETGPEPKVFTLKEGIWFCMMSLTPQGGGETPKALSGRLIAATWWLFGFIIIATYTANLAAFLTVSRLETPIESLDDLSKQFKIKYAPMNGSTSMIYFQRMADIEKKFYEIWKNMSLNDNLGAVERAKLAVWDYPVSDKYTKLWETMTKFHFPENKEEAVKKVLEEDFAFISDATMNKYETLINCDLMVVGEEFSRKPYALAVQEGSPLRAELSTAILTLINNRTLEELKTRWWKRDAKVCPKLDDESDGISIRNIGGVFLVIVIGSGLSLITLTFECYWYRFRPARRAKTSHQNQLKTSKTTSNDNSKPDNNPKFKGAHPGVTGDSTLDASYSSNGFELSEFGVSGYTNAGYEHSERF